MYWKSLALLTAMAFLPSFASAQAVTDPPGIFEPDAVKNVDVASLAEGMDRVIYEMAFSESANLQTLLQYDYDRLVKYYQDLSDTVGIVCTTQRADWPFSFERMYNIDYLTTEVVDEGITNPALRWTIRWTSGMIANMSRSESASLSNGMLVDDCDRLAQGFDKLNVYLAQYEVEADQADKPQSSPFQQELNVGGGQ